MRFLCRPARKRQRSQPPAVPGQGRGTRERAQPLFSIPFRPMPRPSLASAAAAAMERASNGAGVPCWGEKRPGRAAHARGRGRRGPSRRPSSAAAPSRPVPPPLGAWPTGGGCCFRRWAPQTPRLGGRGEAGGEGEEKGRRMRGEREGARKKEKRELCTLRRAVRENEERQR